MLVGMVCCDGCGKGEQVEVRFAEEVTYDDNFDEADRPRRQRDESKQRVVSTTAWIEGAYHCRASGLSGEGALSQLEDVFDEMFYGDEILRDIIGGEFQRDNEGDLVWVCEDCRIGPDYVKDTECYIDSDDIPF